MTATLISEKTEHVTSPEQVRECYMDRPDLLAIFLYCEGTVEIYHSLLSAVDNLKHRGILRQARYEEHYNGASVSPISGEMENFKRLLRPLAAGLPIYSGFREYTRQCERSDIGVFHKDNVHWAAFISTNPAKVAIQQELSFQFCSASKHISTECLKDDDPEVRFVQGRPGTMTILPGFGRAADIEQTGRTAWHKIELAETGEDKLSIAGHLNYRIIG